MKISRFAMPLTVVNHSIIVLSLSLLCLVAGCADYGTKLMFNGGELYYTDKVTEAEAKKLGNYLVKENFFDGKEKSVQLDKEGTQYKFRMVTKKEYLHDSDFIGNVRVTCTELSENVFNGAPVVAHLCDDEFKTVRIVTAPDYGKKLAFNGGTLYYTPQVTEEEAKKLGEYLVKEGFFDGRRTAAQLNKSENTYQFRVIVKEGLDKDQKYLATLKEFAQQLSTDIFNGAPVEIHACNDTFTTLKVVTA